MMKIIVAMLLSASVSNAWAQEGRERFQLFSDCARVNLYVVVQKSDDTVVPDMSEEVIRNAVESRLRSARIYEDEFNWPLLNVYVQLVGNAFSVRLSLEKYVFDVVSGETSYAETWARSYTGTYGRDASYVLSAATELMDAFLVEYLRVNEEACESQ